LGSTLVTPLYVLYEEAFEFSELTLTLIFAAYSLASGGVRGFASESVAGTFKCSQYGNLLLPWRLTM